MSTYEVTPVRIVLPAVPILEASPRPLSEVRDEQVVRITGITTLPTTLASARQGAQVRLADAKARVKAGHPEALIELLDAHAAFTALRWVQEALWTLAGAGRLRRRRGRITGKHRFSPLVVVALVNHLILMGDAENPEQAFGVLEQADILKYGTAKDLYYRGRAGRPLQADRPGVRGTRKLCLRGRYASSARSGRRRGRHSDAELAIPRLGTSTLGSRLFSRSLRWTAQRMIWPAQMAASTGFVRWWGQDLTFAIRGAALRRDFVACRGNTRGGALLS